MRNGIFAAAILIPFATLANASSSTQAHPEEASRSRVESCASTVKTYRFTRGEADFGQVLALTRDAISSNVDREKSVPFAASGRSVLVSDPQWMRISSESLQCGAQTKTPDAAPAAGGDCNDEGCIGNLRGEFANLPIGSTLSISTCGSEPAGMATASAVHVKNDRDQWVMTRYTTEQVKACGSME